VYDLCGIRRSQIQMQIRCWLKIEFLFEVHAQA